MSSRSSEVKLSNAEHITKAGALQVLKLVEYNLSFSSVEGDSKYIKMMFPDLKIARKYLQSSTKIKHVIQHRIAPYISDLLKTSFRNTPLASFLMKPQHPK